MAAVEAAAHAQQDRPALAGCVQLLQRTALMSALLRGANNAAAMVTRHAGIMTLIPAWNGIPQ